MPDGLSGKLLHLCVDRPLQSSVICNALCAAARLVAAAVEMCGAAAVRKMLK